MRLCFLDLETTGFDPEKDSILECSFIIRDEKNLEKTEIFDRVFVPDKSELTPFVSHLTGISEAEIKKDGQVFARVADEISELIDGCTIVGHNIDFDINFLAKNGVKISENPRIDTHELARILLVGEESFALEVLSQKYGFAHRSAHRALSDVEANGELFDFLVEKINSLPSDFLGLIRPFLESEKCNWGAKNLFLDAKGGGDFLGKAAEKGFKIPRKTTNYAPNFPDFADDKWYFFPAGFDASASAGAIAEMTEKESETRFAIISGKRDFFADFSVFPTPEVLFDPEKIQRFADCREVLDDLETTFFLKCQWRHFCGLRGLAHFDLFFRENDFWAEVRADANSEVFLAAQKERESARVLVISPAAFLRFAESAAVAGRTIIFDEFESFVREMLFAPASEFSLKKHLNSADEKISVATQFVVSRFCQKILEPKLGHRITPFPQKILLGEREKFSDFADEIREIDPENSEIQSICRLISGENLGKKIVRWMSYFPDSGGLNFGVWDGGQWREFQKVLRKFPQKRAFFRVRPSGYFAKIFVGIEWDEMVFVDKNPITKPSLHAPKSITATTDPSFFDWCAGHIFSAAEKSPPRTAAIFSSMETMRNIFETAISQSQSEKFLVKSEKISGGTGKILAAAAAENLILFSQKMQDAKLAELDFSTVLVQSFPFDPPHPLLEKFEKELEKSGHNFFQLWVQPNVAANLSRRISAFCPQKIILIDPRQNASWGRKIIELAFGELPKIHKF